MAENKVSLTIPSWFISLTLAFFTVMYYEYNSTLALLGMFGIVGFCLIGALLVLMVVFFPVIHPKKGYKTNKSPLTKYFLMVVEFLFLAAFLHIQQSVNTFIMHLICTMQFITILIRIVIIARMNSIINKHEYTEE